MSRYVKDGAAITGSRYKYPFFFDHPTTIRSGYWIPVFADSYVAPGSTYNLNFQAFLRALPMTRPPMGDLEMVVGAFFVPHRINWVEFKEHFGENNTTAWTGNYNIERPKVEICTEHSALSSDGYADFEDYAYLPYGYVGGFNILPDSGRAVSDGYAWDDYFNVCNLGGYFGYPIAPSGDGVSGFYLVEALKGRAYASIWNEFVRDQNESAPILFLKTTTTTGLEDSGLLQMLRFAPAPIMKAHDLFTGTLPNPQKASKPVSLPIGLGGKAPVLTDSSDWVTGAHAGLKMKNATNGQIISGNLGLNGSYVNATGNAQTGTDVYPSNLYVEFSGQYAANISDFRNAVIIQHYYETLAQFGSKYYEIAQAIWKTRPSNVREDLPEGIGHAVFPINIQAVTSTASTASQPLGYQAAKSETYKEIPSMFTYTTKEHGTIMVCVGIRQARHVYSNRMSRDFFDFDLFSEVNPLFVGSSDVPVYSVECDATAFINATGSATPIAQDKVLGYQEYGYQEKFAQPSYASSLMNPHLTGALTDFTMADAYSSSPVLGPRFVIEDPNFIGRAFVDNSPFAMQFVCDFRLTGSVTRVLAPKTVPGLTRI